MSKTRTAVMLDDGLVERASKATGIKKTSLLIEHALKDLLRRASMRAMADALGTEEEAPAVTSTSPRRRSA
jgi:Arc/MetJ family transcription regulator